MASSSNTKPDPIKDDEYDDLDDYIANLRDPSIKYAAQPYMKVATQTTYKVPTLRYTYDLQWVRQRPAKWRRGSSWSVLKIADKEKYNPYPIHNNPLPCEKMKWYNDGRMCKSCSTPVTPPPSPTPSPPRSPIYDPSTSISARISNELRRSLNRRYPNANE